MAKFHIVPHSHETLIKLPAAVCMPDMARVLGWVSGPQDSHCYSAWDQIRRRAQPFMTSCSLVYQYMWACQKKMLLLSLEFHFPLNYRFLYIYIHDSLFFFKAIDFILLCELNLCLRLFATVPVLLHTNHALISLLLFQLKEIRIVVHAKNKP